MSKSAAPQPHRAVTVREQNINASRKAPPRFYNLSQRTLWIWTPLCKQRCLQMSAERIHVVVAAQQKWGGKKIEVQLGRIAGAIATGRLYNSVEDVRVQG